MVINTFLLDLEIDGHSVFVPASRPTNILSVIAEESQRSHMLSFRPLRWPRCVGCRLQGRQSDNRACGSDRLHRCHIVHAGFGFRHWPSTFLLFCLLCFVCDRAAKVIFGIVVVHAQAFGGNPYRQLLPLCGSIFSCSSGSCMRSLETPRDGVRIRLSGQILRFTFHGCGFVDGCEPFCGGQQKVCISWRTCVALAIRPQVLYWQYRSACMATGIFVSTSFGRPFSMWSLPKRFHSPTWDFAVSSTLFACQWTSNIVPVTVLPSLIYSTLTRTAQSHSEFLSFSTPGRACQDVRVVYAIERAGPEHDARRGD